MKKYLSLLLLLMISNVGFGAVEYRWDGGGGIDNNFWTAANWNPDRTTLLWDDTMRIQPTTLTDVNCLLTSENMVGGIWRMASTRGAQYNMTIHGTGSLAISNCSGLVYENPISGTTSGTYGNVDFQSGTIYVTGNGGNPSEPNNTSSAFKIAHRGEAYLTIRNGAVFKMLGSGGLWVAGTANSAETNRGRLVVAGQLDMGSSTLYVVRKDNSGSAAATANTIQGKLVLESTGSIIGSPHIWIACNPKMEGIFDINTNATLDLINSPTVSHLIVADLGIGTLNIKSGARFMADDGRFSIALGGSNRRAIATINVESGGVFGFPNQSLTFVDSNTTADVNHVGTAYLNIAADACCYGRSVLGATGPNDTFNFNLDGEMTATNYFYLTTYGKATANMNAGSIFTGVIIKGARSMGSQATINSSGDVTLYTDTGSSYIVAGHGTGVLNILDGSIYMPGGTMYACDGNGIGTINISGGSLTVPKLKVSSNSNGTGSLNISGGEFIAEEFFTTIAERNNASMTITGGTATVNRLVLANFPDAVGTATITGGRLNVNGHIAFAQDSNEFERSSGTLTIGGTADVNVADWDPYNTSRGIMVGQIKRLDDPYYSPKPIVSEGTAIFILDGSHATVKTSYFTLGGRVVDGEGGVTDANTSQFHVKLDGVHGVGSGIYATYDVFLSDGPAADTGIVPSFNGDPAVGIYNVIKAEGSISVDTSFRGNLMLNSPGWSYKVVDAGDQQRLKLLYCDKGDNSCLVDLRCFAAFAAQWVDGNADGYDLAYLANNWLKTFSSF
jgi:hypothetical protein